MPPEVLKRQVSSAGFAELEAYQRLAGPLSPEREDWRAALIASVIYNANRDPKKSKELTPNDFIPDWAKHAGVETPEKSQEEIAAVGEAWYDRLKARSRAMASRRGR